jgi:hypothetical protein
MASIGPLDLAMQEVQYLNLRLFANILVVYKVKASTGLCVPAEKLGLGDAVNRGLQLSEPGKRRKEALPGSWLEDQ